MLRARWRAPPQLVTALTQQLAPTRAPTRAAESACHWQSQLAVVADAVRCAVRARDAAPCQQRAHAHVPIIIRTTRLERSARLDLQDAAAALGGRMDVLQLRRA